MRWAARFHGVVWGEERHSSRFRDISFSSLALRTTDRLELLIGASGLSPQRMSSLGTGNESGLEGQFQLC